MAVLGKNNQNCHVLLDSGGLYITTKTYPPPPLRNPILSPTLDKIIEALFSFPFQIAIVYLPYFLVTFKKFRYNSIFSQLIFGHYTVPKGKLGAEMFLIFRRNI